MVRHSHDSPSRVAASRLQEMLSAVVGRLLARALRRLLVAAALGVSLAGGTGTPRAASPESNGIGIALGTPTAIDLSLRSARDHNLNLGVGSLGGHDLALYAEAEFALSRFGTGPRGPLGRVYLGGGGLLAVLDDHDGFWDHHHDHHDGDGHAHVEAVMPFGVDFTFVAPIQVFAELRPGLALIGHPFHLHLGAQVGVRYLW